MLRWAFAALNSLDLPLLSLWFVNLTGGKDTRPSHALAGWADMRLQQLDGWLAARAAARVTHLGPSDAACRASSPRSTGSRRP